MTEELDELRDEEVEGLIGDLRLQTVSTVLTQLVQGGHCPLQGREGEGRG